jgi:alpha-galactosidase
MKSIIPFVMALFSLGQYSCGLLEETGPPVDAASLIYEENTLTLIYNGRVLFEGRVNLDRGQVRLNTLTDKNGRVLSQVVSLTSRGKEPVVIEGTLRGSYQSFPCEVDRPVYKKDLVRHSYGLSRNTRNDGIYDRQSDWVFSIDYPASVIIDPPGIQEDSLDYEMTISGYQVGLRFRPRYFQQHRGLAYFEPWNYEVWRDPVTGWCSWYAYFQDVTEQNIRDMADALETTLVPFGLEYLQIDDGYQQEPAGLPETWNIPNEKFPSGMNALSQYISNRGMKPGIWTYTSFRQADFANEHTEYFVTDENGEPVSGRWVGYVLDGSNPSTLDSIITPIYTNFVDMGWKYFKVDALRHLRYEGYNSYADYYKERNLNHIAVYRNFVQSIRDAIGPENFMLGCWGPRPELVGMIDGCRIGGDGYGYACLTQFNSFNNVVWRNDPDHIELTEEEAYRSSMVTSLTGSLFMVTDKPEVYRSELIEPAKRAIPVLHTVPGQLYDVDPSRSMNLLRADAEVSGDRQRPFEGSIFSPYNLFLLELNTPFESWVVLGRTEEKEREILFEDLGLDRGNDYHVYEFWTGTYFGTETGGFEPGPIHPKFNCQLWVIREKRPHPQIVSTSRHISAGALELRNVAWENNRLTGSSAVVAGDPYTMILYEPEGYQFRKIEVDKANLSTNIKTGTIRTIALESPVSDTIHWQIRYDRN